MIEAGLEFLGSIHAVVPEFVSLPELVRPVHFSHDERLGSNADRVEDIKRFSAFITKAKSGFFLLGPSATYSIRIAADGHIRCDCFLEVEPATVEGFMKYMASAQPIFGFACAPAEREKRNSITTKQGASTITSWVGRDTRKYVPGLYWITLLTDALAANHGVPIPMLKAIAKEHKELGRGQHLYRFYDRPEDWLATVEVSNLCASLPGVFDVENVRLQVAEADNFLKLSEILRDWK